MLYLNRIKNLNCLPLVNPIIFITLLLTLSACKSYRVEKIVPEETATVQSLAEMSDLSTLPSFKQGRYIQFSSYQRADSSEPPGGFIEKYLPDYWPLGWPGNYDSNHFVCHSEDAEIAQFIIAPYRFEEESCEEDYIKGAVMARFEGSGTLSRFWMTQLSAPSGLNANEILRIYRDDQPEPILQVMLKEIYSGDAGEIFAKPFGAEKKDFINWNYPIDFNSKLIVTLDRLGIPFDLYYYQVDAVLDPVPTEKSPSETPLAERNDAQQFLNNFSGAALIDTDAASIVREFNQNSASSPNPLSIAGPGTIQGLQIDYHPEDHNALVNASISITWDESSVAAISMPLLDFFSARQVIPPAQQYLLTSEQDEAAGQSLRLSLPMPFASSADIEIEIPEPLSAPLTLQVDLLEGVLPATNWGYLHTQFNHTENPEVDKYHTLLSQQGQGRLAGVCVQIEGKSGNGFGSTLPFSFLEGDELGTIDDELTIHGTGTEDYFNSSFYFQNNEEDATPFAQVWGLSHDEANNKEQVSACRWHLFSDTIDFQQEIEFKIEMGALTPDAVRHYRSTAYFYQ